MPVSLFFHNTGPNLALILPLRPHPLSFLANFQWNMLGDSININNFCCNPAILKNLGETFNLIFFFFWIGAICTTKRSAWATPKMKNNFLLAEITKANHQLSDTFYIKISCFGWVMLSMNLFSILCDVFYQKRVICS